MTAIGVDPSLNSTGIVAGTSSDALVTALIEGRSDEPREDRLDRLRRGVGTFTRRAAPVIAAIETPSYGSASHRELAGGVQWFCRVGLRQPSVDQLLLVAPGQLKVWVADDGHASKDEMRVALYDRAGLWFESDDVVDAAGLWCLARFVAGESQPLDPSGKQAAVAKAVARKRISWR